MGLMSRLCTNFTGVCGMDAQLALGTADSVESAYQKTIEREKTIKTKGYEMEVIWEHDFDLKLKENPDMAKFYKEFKSDIRTLLIRVTVSMEGGRGLHGCITQKKL